MGTRKAEKKIRKRQKRGLRLILLEEKKLSKNVEKRWGKGLREKFKKEFGEHYDKRQIGERMRKQGGLEGNG